MSSSKKTMPTGSTGTAVRPLQAAAMMIVIALAPVVLAGGTRARAFRKTPAPGTLVVGAEYRIPAHPDSPWLESVAAAAGASSGMVVWTESGPGDQESTLRFARLGTDGHPIDTSGRPLLENGHDQRHVAIDAINDRFVVAWCDITSDKNQIVALRLDAGGQGLDRAPLVIAGNLGNNEPEVGVTCGNTDCLVTWGGDGRNGAFAIGAVNGVRLSPFDGRLFGSPLQLMEKGLGNGIGTNQLNYCMVYAEQLAYGQSGALVAKLLTADGLTTELPLDSLNRFEVGTAWAAWNGTEWFILMLDLTTSGELAQEVRLMRVDGSGHSVGDPGATLLESAAVPLLCPRVPDLFLYDPQNRRVVWDGKNFLIFTQHSITRVTGDGLFGPQLSADDYFPRGYATSISSSGGGRTLVAYSRDDAVAVRLVQDVP
jgi:hypothetical protein